MRYTAIDTNSGINGSNWSVESSIAGRKVMRGRGEGTVFKRENRDSWVARLNLGYKNGKRVRKDFFGKTQKEAREKMARAMEQITNGQALPDQKMTVGQFLGWWEQEILESSDRAYRTKEYYRTNIHTHLIPHLGQIKLTTLQHTHIRTMLNKMEAKGSSTRTRQAIHATLKVVLRDAEKEELVQKNVAKLTSVKMSKKIEVRPYTSEEAAVLLAFIEGHPYKAIITLAMTTGLRQAEILGLTWDSLDIENGMIAVRQTLASRGTKKQGNQEWVFAPTKTDRSNRVLWLPEITKEALREHRAKQEAELGQQALVFTREDGSPVSRHALSKEFSKVVEGAGLRHQRFHDLRHACASYWAAQGMSLHEIMGFLGHSSISLTANLYTHLLFGTSQEAASRMDSFLKEAIHG